LVAGIEEYPIAESSRPPNVLSRVPLMELSPDPLAISVHSSEAAFSPAEMNSFVIQSDQKKMQTPFKLMVSILLLVGIASCDSSTDDDDDNNVENGFTYNGVFYQTELFGVQYFSGSTLNIYFIDASGWDTPNNQIIDEVYNEMAFRIYSYTDGAIAPGEYTYSSSSTNDGSFRNPDGDCELTINFNRTTSLSDEHVCVESGTMTIAKDGDTYTVDYSVILEDNQTVNGHYEGSLDFIKID